MRPGPADPLTKRLGELDEAHLVLRCACGMAVTYPLLLMGRRRGRSTLLSDVLPRLKCKTCTQPPAYVELTDNPIRDVSGRENDRDAWWIDLTAIAERLREHTPPASTGPSPLRS